MPYYDLYQEPPQPPCMTKKELRKFMAELMAILRKRKP